MPRMHAASIPAIAFALLFTAAAARADEPAAAPQAKPDAAAPAPAAAAPQAKPAATSGETTLDGIWMFDAKHSDDPRKVMESLRPQGGGDGGGGGGRRWGGGGGGGGGFGGGGGGFGGGRHRGGGGGEGGGQGGGAPDENAQQQRGPSPFARVMRPANKVVIELLADQVKVSEDEAPARPYAIEDSLKAHGHDLVTEGTSARWKGSKLEMTQANGQRGSLVEEYELSKDGQTLTIRAHREGGREGMPNPTITRVYTRYTGE